MSHPPRTPPRFVPTLTEVVEVAKEKTSAPDETPATSAPRGIVMAQMSDEEAFRLEEDLLHRVLQRVDLALEARLHTAVSKAVQRQLETMVPQLRGEIETVLRDLVVEALARELSENAGPVPSS